MKQLPATSFKIAIIHTLRGGIFPLLISSFVAVLLSLKITDELFKTLVPIVLVPLGMWVGAKISAKSAAKKYIVENPRSVIILSTFLIIIFRFFETLAEMVNHEFPVLVLFSSVLSVTLFMLASQRNMTQTAFEPAVVIGNDSHIDTKDEFPAKKASLIEVLSVVTSSIFIILCVLILFSSVMASGAPGGLGAGGIIIVILAFLTISFALYSLSNIGTQVKLKNYKKLKFYFYVPFFFFVPLLMLIIFNFFGLFI